MGGGADSDGEDGAHSMELCLACSLQGWLFFTIAVGGLIDVSNPEEKRRETYLRYKVDRLWAQADRTRPKLGSP